MKILMIREYQSLSLTVGQEVDTTVDNITDAQAQALCLCGFATDDLKALDPRRFKYISGKIYENEAVVVESNNVYQLLPNIQSSATFIASEWELLVKGAL